MSAEIGFVDTLKGFMGQNPLYILAGVAWIVYVSRLEMKKKKKAVCMLLILIIAVFNPYIYWDVAARIGQTSTYYRFLWIIPYGMAFVYFLYEMIRQIENIKYRLALVAAVCVFILYVNAQNWKAPDSIYQLPSDVIDVADALEILREKSGDDHTVILADMNISGIIRMYDANIYLPFSDSFALQKVNPQLNVESALGLMSMLMYNRNNFPAEVVERIVEKNAIDYLIVSKENQISAGYLYKLGWRVASATEEYYIFEERAGDTEEAYSIEPLTINGIETEEITTVIPGLTEEYHFLFISDLHLIAESEEIIEEEKDNVRSRMQSYLLPDKRTAAEYWYDLPEILNLCNADAIFMGGSMIDFCSASNVDCLKKGIDKLDTSYIYIRADRDTVPFFCGEIGEDEAASMQAAIDGNPEVWCMEFPEFCIVGLSNSTDQISESGLEQMKAAFAIGKPVILLTHVPYAPETDGSLAETSTETWQGLPYLWGENCYYQPDDNTKELMNMIYAEDSPVKEILSGHLQFSWDGYITENTHQHVFSPAFSKKVGVITVRGEN